MESVFINRRISNGGMIMSSTAAATILSRLKSLEAQVMSLRIEAEKLFEQEHEGSHTIADLFGALEGKVSTNEDEINALLYREPPNMDEYYPLPLEGSADDLRP
jgi:hypothetical protein